MMRIMKIFEVLWLIASLIALTMAIVKAIHGEAYGSYIYITVFTAAVAFFMYRFKKKNRLYLEKYYRQKAEEAEKRRQEAEKQQETKP